MGKEIVSQAQEVQRVPYRAKPRRKMPTHILITLTKSKYKEKILKAAREKQQKIYKGNPIRLSADFSEETLKARREWQDIFKVMKGENLQPNYTTQQGSHSDLMEKSKLYRKTKVKRIQHHQTSSTKKAKEIL